MSEHKWKVGDALAFREGFASESYVVRKIDKITPSGLVKCGSVTLDPDLRIRGTLSRWSARYAEPVTPKICAAIRRERGLVTLKTNDWEKLTDSQINRVVELLESFDGEPQEVT